MRDSGYIRDGRSPIPKTPITSRTMSANKAKNTRPEIKLRKGLRAVGLSDYKLHPKNLPGRPDVVFPGRKLAIFVNGCFWHRCPHCKPKNPKTHSKFWETKFQNNIERDKRNIRTLRRAGWRVNTIWECRLRKNEVGEIKKIERSYFS